MVPSTSDRPGSRPGLAEWADSVLAELRERPEVGRVGLALLEGGGRRLLSTTSDRASTDPRWVHLDAYADEPLNDAIGSGTKLVGALADLDPRYAPFVEVQTAAGFASIAAVPLKSSGRVLGGFMLLYAQRQPFDPGDCDELDALADDMADRLYLALRRPGPTIPQYSPPTGSLVAAQEFPADLASVWQARLFLRETLDEWDVDDDTSQTAALCLSELVTNALIHAHSGCCVQIELHEQVLRIEVHDSGPGLELQDALGADRHEVHGRGLRLLDAMTSRWGQIDGPDRAVVWFALDLP